MRETFQIHAFCLKFIFVCCLLIVLENPFAERHDKTIFRVENSLVRQGKPVTISTRPYRQTTRKYERTSVNFEP